MGSNILQTKLDKVKSFMDNGSFVFTFNKERPFAIHEDQLFKNQLATEYTDAYGKIKYKINAASSVRKTERIIDFKGDAKTGYGILFSDNTLVVPTRLLKDSAGNPIYQNGYFKLIVPNITKIVNGIEQSIKDKIITFDINSEGIIYILTELGLIYRFYTKEKYDMNITDYDDNRVNGEFICNDEITNLLNLENKSEKIMKLFYGSYVVNVYGETSEFYDGLYLLSNKGNLYFRSNTLELSYNPNTEGVVGKILEHDFEGSFLTLKKICSKYNRTFFLYKSGKVEVLGENTKGSLGIGNDTETVYTKTKLGSSLSENVISYSKISLINSSAIEDIAIGKTHTLFLTKNGIVFGFGDNTYNQLGTKTSNATEYVDDFVVYDIKNTTIKRIAATDYGSIMLSYSGRFIYVGTFLNRELELTTPGNPIAVDEINYSSYLIGKFPTVVARTFEVENSTRKLVPTFFVDLANISGPGVFIYKENGMCYYTGDNTLHPIGPAFGDQVVSVWTPLENSENDLMRTAIYRPEFWSYYDDFILKADKFKGNQIVNIFYKNHNGVWIDWIKFYDAYKNVAIRDENNNFLTKTKKVYALDGETVIKININYDAYIYEAKKNIIELLYKVDKRIIPTVDYIDSNLKVWTINPGDNCGYKVYDVEDAESENSIYIEKIESLNVLKTTYQASLLETDDLDKIEEYNNKLAEIDFNIVEFNELIAENIKKQGTIVPSKLLTYPNTILLDPMEKVGEEEKTVVYARSRIVEPTNSTVGEITNEIIKTAKTVNSFITKVKPEFVDLDAILGTKEEGDELFKDDIKLSLIDEEDITKNHSFDSFLVWMSGRFVNKDYFLKSDHKSFCIKDGMSFIGVRRISEAPDLLEPSRADLSIIPHIEADNATVREYTYPTELRWDLDFKLFGWENINVDGPHKIHNGPLNTELSGIEYFYYGDVYVPVYTKVRFPNKTFEKGTFILFFDGVVVPENEYSVSSRNGETIISLQSFAAFIAKTLQREINVNDPGYRGHVKFIAELYSTLKQFSIAFLSTTEKYKKVKVHCDSQNIRNFPRPGEITFRDIKYNDLILVDGYYLPYQWEANSCISFPDTNIRFHDSENDFINHSNIYRLQPYITNKREDELTDTECRSFAFENNLITESEYIIGNIKTIRELVKSYIQTNNLNLDL